MASRLRDALERQWLGVAIGTVALLVAAGVPSYAQRAVSKALFAKRAAFAKKAGNAKKVGGIKASRAPAAGRLLPLGADLKLPASVLPASNSVIRFEEFASSGGRSGHEVVFCEDGERATGGGIGWSGSPGSGDAVMFSGPEDAADGFPPQGTTATGWAGEIRTSDADPKPGRVYVVCTR